MARPRGFGGAALGVATTLVLAGCSGSPVIEEPSRSPAPQPVAPFEIPSPPPTASSVPFVYPDGPEPIVVNAHSGLRSAEESGLLTDIASIDVDSGPLLVRSALPFGLTESGAVYVNVFDSDDIDAPVNEFDASVQEAGSQHQGVWDPATGEIRVLPDAWLETVAPEDSFDWDLVVSDSYLVWTSGSHQSESGDFKPPRWFAVEPDLSNIRSVGTSTSDILVTDPAGRRWHRSALVAGHTLWWVEGIQPDSAELSPRAGTLYSARIDGTTERAAQAEHVRSATRDWCAADGTFGLFYLSSPTPPAEGVPAELALHRLAVDAQGNVLSDAVVWRGADTETASAWSAAGCGDDFAITWNLDSEDPFADDAAVIDIEIDGTLTRYAIAPAVSTGVYSVQMNAHAVLFTASYSVILESETFLFDSSKREMLSLSARGSRADSMLNADSVVWIEMLPEDIEADWQHPGGLIFHHLAAAKFAASKPEA